MRDRLPLLGVLLRHYSGMSGGPCGPPGVARRPTPPDIVPGGHIQGAAAGLRARLAMPRGRAQRAPDANRGRLWWAAPVCARPGARGGLPPGGPPFCPPLPPLVGGGRAKSRRPRGFAASRCSGRLAALRAGGRLPPAAFSRAPPRLGGRGGGAAAAIFVCPPAHLGLFYLGAVLAVAFALPPPVPRPRAGEARGYERCGGLAAGGRLFRPSRAGFPTQGRKIC